MEYVYIFLSSKNVIIKNLASVLTIGLKLFPKGEYFISIIKSFLICYPPKLHIPSG